MNWGSKSVAVVVVILVGVGVGVGVGGTDTNNRSREEEEKTTPPRARAWPEQFHSLLLMNYSGELQVIDLWYDWTNGRNFNIIQYQLGDVLYDLEWNNGTSFFYTTTNTTDKETYCSSAQLEVGILRPNWLEGANYVGQRHLDGFLCNVWEKADFITYYEDVLTYRPVHWLFYSGRGAHVMTFEVGAVLEDAKWQVPSYCFDNNKKNTSTATSTGNGSGDDNYAYAYAASYKQQQQQVTNNALDMAIQRRLIDRLIRGSVLF
ncbi:hypothetical protein LguiB_024547 [Lonicera macranthoides]